MIDNLCVETTLSFLLQNYTSKIGCMVIRMANVHTFLLCLSWFCLGSISAQLNITTIEVLRDPETLEASNAIFKLGFFSTVNSTNRYLGIWYTNRDSHGLEVVWVANRDNPLNDSSGVLKISEDGNLQVLNGQNKSFWSSNLPAYKVDNLVAQLYNNGNLVLLSNGSGAIIWQSFDHPTDSFLPQMTFTIDQSIGEKQVLFRSWKSMSNPSSGNFTVGINTRNPPEVFLWNGDRPVWRNGPWNGNLLFTTSTVLSIINDNEGKIYFGFSEGNQSSLRHFVVNYNGGLVQRDWDYNTKEWGIVWQSRQSDCDVYGYCGPFGSCKSTNSPVCGCLEGFVPKNSEQWKKGNWTDGCVRRTPLDCGSTGGTTDGFWKLRNVKVPDDAVWTSANGENECSSQCLGNCSCVAYAYFSSIGCMVWNGSLIDTDELSENRGIDLSIRLAYSELGKINQQQERNGSVKHSKWKIIVIVGLITGTAIVGISMCYIRIRWLRRQYDGRRVKRKDIRLRNYSFEGTSEDAFGDLPLFGLEKLVTATNNFQENNKLGRGGFGIVYKGKLEDGQDIAVKRLSKASGQGVQEFMNEVLVISKLQHRNLVRLLGCCAEGEEKLLVYEYMPNKSLDALLFDAVNRELLDWERRFNIIQGICRGLLYLHRDSRLKIVHRDLKASNILLDGNLTPKISDFGMARIFGGNEDQADTKKVVGTYGYMSPEYAMEGRFSEKSDVFSLGVLLLEIVTGRKNGSFKNEESLGLVGHAWKLWNADDIMSLIDPTISRLSFQAEILRCIHVALLCVQDFPEDRPSISTIISMIDNEVSNLPSPTQPGFTQRRVASRNMAIENDLEYYSVNRVSVSVLSGR